MSSARARNLEQRVVLLSKRDALALEWELHQIRWLMTPLTSAVSSAITVLSTGEPPPDPPRLEYGQSSREEIIAHRQKIWERTPGLIDQVLGEYHAERAWMAARKPIAPLHALRVAVRESMAKTGGAPLQPEPLDDPADDEAISELEIRSMRWLLFTRSEIAGRRIRCGEYHLLLQTVRERDDLPEGWAWEQLQELIQRHHPLADRDRTDGWDAEQVLGLALRRERAASAFEITGGHLIPGWIDLDRVGAYDTGHPDA